jgi:hypothetical protein
VCHINATCVREPRKLAVCVCVCVLTRDTARAGAGHGTDSDTRLRLAPRLLVTGLHVDPSPQSPLICLGLGLKYRIAPRERMQPVPIRMKRLKRSAFSGTP